jgi:predicted nicotinamide N-methyase
LTFKKYAIRLINRARRVIPPIYGENYDRHWNYISFNSKTILDIGANHGSTAYFFLRKGASKIIAVEGDPKLASELCRNFGKNKKIICRKKWISSGKDFDDLVNAYHPDVVKVDIEGAEKHLSDSTILPKVKEWLVETHSEDLHQQTVTLLKQCGFQISTVSYDDCKIVIGRGK